MWTQRSGANHLFEIQPNILLLGRELFLHLHALIPLDTWTAYVKCRAHTFYFTLQLSVQKHKSLQTGNVFVHLQVIHMRQQYLGYNSSATSTWWMRILFLTKTYLVLYYEK